MAYETPVSPEQVVAIRDAVAEAFKLFERGNPIKAPPVLAISEQDVRRIFGEEIDRALDKHEDTLLMRCRSTIDELLADLEMPVKTPEEKRKTQKKLSNLFELQEAAHTWKSEFVSTLVKSSAGWAAGIVTAGVAYVLYRGGH